MKRRIFVSSFGHIALTGLLKDSGKLLPGSSVGKESSCNSGDPRSISGSGRSPGEALGEPLWYSGLENSIVHGVTKSRTQLSDFHFQFHFTLSPFNHAATLTSKTPLNFQVQRSQRPSLIWLTTSFLKLSFFDFCTLLFLILCPIFNHFFSVTFAESSYSYAVG